MNNSFRKMERSEPAFDGTVKEGFKRRFTLINERDYQNYVPASLKSKFEEVHGKVAKQIEDCRVRVGKKPYNAYVVINLDEPYIGEIIEILKRHGHWG